jgi:hypothetical protein
MAKKGKRVNTYFRQTAKAFKAARQTKVFTHIKRNLPYRIFQYTKDKFSDVSTKLKPDSKSRSGVFRLKKSRQLKKAMKNKKDK